MEKEIIPVLFTAVTNGAEKRFRMFHAENVTFEVERRTIKTNAINIILQGDDIENPKDERYHNEVIGKLSFKSTMPIVVIYRATEDQRSGVYVYMAKVEFPKPKNVSISSTLITTMECLFRDFVSMDIASMRYETEVALEKAMELARNRG